jgi:hypothetical protein
MAYLPFTQTTSNVEFTIINNHPTVAKFLCKSNQAHFILISDGSNAEAYPSYLGIDGNGKREAFIASENANNKQIAFGTSDIFIHSTATTEHLLPSSNNVYDLQQWETMNIKSNQFLLGQSQLRYENDSIALINNKNAIYKHYMEINAKQVKLCGDDNSYTILSTGASGAILSRFSANDEPISVFNIGKATTSEIPEGDNKYFTPERVSAMLVTSDTDFTQGSNQLVAYQSNMFANMPYLIAATDAENTATFLQNSNSLLSVSSSATYYQYLQSASNDIRLMYQSTSNELIQTYLSSNYIIDYIKNDRSTLDTLIQNESNLLAAYAHTIRSTSDDLIRLTSNQSATSLSIYQNDTKLIVHYATQDATQYFQSTYYPLQTDSGPASNDLRQLATTEYADASNYLATVDTSTTNTLNTSRDQLHTRHTNLYANGIHYIDSITSYISDQNSQSSNMLETINTLGIQELPTGSNEVIVNGIYPKSTLSVSNLNTFGDVLPEQQGLRDLGTPQNKWRDLFVSANTIYIDDTALSLDPVTQNVQIVTKQDPVSLTAAAIKLYDAVGQNYTSLESVGYSIEQTVYLASGEIDASVSKVVTTDVVPEPESTSNMYYTSARAADIITASNLLSSNYCSTARDVLSNRVTTLTADNLRDGLSSEFIVNGAYYNDLLVKGTLIASNLNVQSATKTIINITKYETENVTIVSDSDKQPAIKVVQKGVTTVASLNPSANDVLIKASGLSVKAPANNSEALGTSSNVLFAGSINSLTSNHLNFVRTLRASAQQQLSDVPKLFGDYVTSTSNNLYNNMLQTVSKLNQQILISDASNYMLTASNINEQMLAKRNTLPDVLNLDASNYVRQASNALWSNLQLQTSNVISTRISTLNRNTSNYMTSVASEFNSNLSQTSNSLTNTIIKWSASSPWIVVSGANIFTSCNVGINLQTPTEKLDILGSINVTGNVNNVSSNNISTLKGLTTSIQPQINNLGTFGSNYIRITSNQIQSNLLGTSNTLVATIRTLNSNMSNYVRVTSNVLRQTITNTSNALVAKFNTLDITKSSPWSNIRGNSNLTYTSNVNIGSNVILGNRRLNIFGGDVSITSGNSKIGVTRTSNETFNPVIWYQFNETPAPGSLVADSNILGNKINMTTLDSLNSPQAMLMWGKFDDGTDFAKNYGTFERGTTVFDASFTVSGVTSDTSDKIIGTASAVFGQNKNVFINMSFDNITILSISFWLKLTALNPNNEDIVMTFGTIFNLSIKRITEGSPQQTNNYWYIVGFATQWDTSSTTVRINANTWEHYAFTFEKNSSGNTNIKLYKNGALGAQTTINGFFNGSSGYVYFSYYNTVNDTTKYFTGKMDDLRMYKRILSLGDVNSIYSSSSNTVLSKVLGYTNNNYLYTNAYYWNGTSDVGDNTYLEYPVVYNDYMGTTIFKAFHTNKAFSIHFVFKTDRITSTTSHILYCNYYYTSDLIRIYIINNALYFQVGPGSALSTTIQANRYYVVDLTFTYVTIGGNFTIKIFLDGVLAASSSTGVYNSIFDANVTYFQIGKYGTDVNDATPVTLQDFRVYTFEFSSAQIAALQSGLTYVKVPVPPVPFIQRYQLQRWNDSSPYYNTTPKFITYQKGNVGIATNNPQANLQVGVGTAVATQNMVYFNTSSMGTSNNFSLRNICATFDSSLLVTGTIASSSDQRIKTDIQDISDDSALQKIKSIQPKTYNYIDVSRSSNLVYGFIAQQIDEVIPEAVTYQTDVIPNIYSYAHCQKNVITFTNDISVENIAINDKIDVYDINNQKSIYSVTGVDVLTNSITIDKEIDSEQVFVYGTQVDNFNSLNKSYIYTLNVCATQNIHQKVTQLQNKLAQLEQKLK